MTDTPDPAPATREQIDAPTAIAEEVCICGQYLNTRGDKAGPELCLANKHTAPASAIPPQPPMSDAMSGRYLGALARAHIMSSSPGGDIPPGYMRKLDADVAITQSYGDGYQAGRAAGAAEERQRIREGSYRFARSAVSDGGHKVHAGPAYIVDADLLDAS